MEAVFLDTPSGGSWPVEIIDAAGAVRYRGRTDGLRTVIPIASLATGTYAVVLDRGAAVVRFIKE